MPEKIAVISTGNGGQSMAAYLAMKGAHVSLYAREQERVDMLPKDRVFHLGGILDADVKIDLISCNMREIIDGAELVMVTTPAQYHHIVAAAMAPHLRDGQMVVLNPGRTFGAELFAADLERGGCSAQVIVAETETFVFTCRCTESGKPKIYEIKNDVGVAAQHQENTVRTAMVLSQYFDDIRTAPSTVFTGFNNIGMVFHPLTILLNITRIEAKEELLFYHDAITPLVANILERLDSERVAVAAAYGADVPSAFDWLNTKYGVEGKDLYERIHNNAAYSNIYAPTDIDTRYIYEDILTGCVPVYCAGKAAGVSTPIIESAIQWASTIYRYDFLGNGRNDKRIDFQKLLHKH